ncbi:MAG: hypothetical protein QG577_1774 [Thermodesulfobacteriota bacterium]|nr:hypothetical protein [Thermodesulfobacteriota bacterium]
MELLSLTDAQVSLINELMIHEFSLGHFIEIIDSIFGIGYLDDNKRRDVVVNIQKKDHAQGRQPISSTTEVFLIKDGSECPR